VTLLCVLYRFGITRRLTSSFDDGVSARLSAAAVAVAALARGMGNSFAECAALLLACGVGWVISRVKYDS
jgi:hypothetical protein